MAEANDGARWGAKPSAGDRAHASTPTAAPGRRASTRDLLAIVAGTLAIAGLGYALTRPDAASVALSSSGGTAAGGADLTPVDGSWNAMTVANGRAAPPVPAVADIPLVARTDDEHIAQTISYGSVMMPRLKAGEVTGFTIRAGSMPPVLARAGVRPGDVLVSVNGRALDSNAVVSGLSHDLAGVARADIVVERGGRRETLTASLRD